MYYLTMGHWSGTVWPRSLFFLTAKVKVSARAVILPEAQGPLPDLSRLLAEFGSWRL